ncbi:MAG: DUF2220 domain-containing protein, partial [Alicyclobacillus sp.]|nr:DUF2220 domain-containing protein [Alicyclobacillus sp.]
MDGGFFARRVLEDLVDKYEDSEAFRKGEPSKRRIQVKLTNALVPGYTDGSLDPEIRHGFHRSLTRMADDGLIELKWVQFEEGNILDRVYLVWEALDKAYLYLGRTSRRDELQGFVTDMEHWLHALLDGGLPADFQWVRAWVGEAIDTATSRGRIPSNLVPVDADTRKLLQRAIAGLVRKGEKTLPIRLFSKQYLGHSKLFEQQVQAHLIRLVRRYWPVHHASQPDLPEDDAVLLRELGIEAGHDDIAFCGPICFRYDDQPGDIDASVFPFGLAVDASDVHRIHVTKMAVSRILTIENKANYRTYVRHERSSDELVIYLGGFASPAQRAFLRLFRDVCFEAAHTPLYHWGDLDYGGILILHHLRQTCWPEAQP